MYIYIYVYNSLLFSDIGLGVRVPFSLICLHT